VTAAPITSGSAPAPPAPSATPGASARRGSVFVRHPPHSANSDADAVDACTQVGGNYFSCRGAYFDETDPVAKRYLWRIAQGGAAGESGYVYRGEAIRQGEVPHAEVPFMCDPRKPCRFKSEHGELNGATSCLARASEAYLMKDAATARAAHARACSCDREEGSFPGYNRTPYICDAAGRAAFIAPAMKKEEGKEILDCAICHPERGPAACQREIERLRTSDPPLSAYIEARQIPRCKTPNEGPREWDTE
jgi:hypothetical protein